MSDALSRPWHHEVARRKMRSIGGRAPNTSLVLGLLALFALVVAAAAAVTGPVSVPSRGADQPAAIAPRATWIDIIKPVRIFDLDSPLLGHGALVYTARRWSAGTEREDTMTFGTFADNQPMVRLKRKRRSAPTYFPSC